MFWQGSLLADGSAGSVCIGKRSHQPPNRKPERLRSHNAEGIHPRPKDPISQYQQAEDSPYLNLWGKVTPNLRFTMMINGRGEARGNISDVAPLPWGPR